MPSLDIYLDADEMLSGVDTNKIIHVTQTVKVGALRGGMESGAPSIGFGIPLPDGRTVLVETSLKLFQTAARAFAVVYGWQDTAVEGQDRQQQMRLNL